MMARGRRLAARFWRAISTAASSYGKDYGPQMAAAISYHALFSLFPLAILLVSIFGLVLQDASLREDVITWLLDALPLSDSAGVRLDQAVSGLAAPTSAAGIVAIVGLLWAASGLMAAIRAGLRAVWNVQRDRPLVQGKLLDFALLLGAGVLFLVAFGTTVLVRVIHEFGQNVWTKLGVLGAIISVAGQATEVVIPLALSFGTFVALYYFVPPVSVRLVDVLPGAGIASIGLQAATIGYGFYLAHFADYNLVYGFLGAAIGFLFLVYIGASIFLYGAQVTASWSSAAEPPPETEQARVPLPRRLWLLVRSLFTHKDAAA